MIALPSLSIPAGLRRAVRRVFPKPRIDPLPIWRTHGYKWCLDATLENENGIAAHCWVAVPAEDLPHLTLTIRGEAFPAQERYERSDVLAALPVIRRAGFGAFGITGHSWRPAEGLVPGSWYPIQIFDRRTNRPYPGLGPVGWHRIPASDDPPLPDSVRRQRVHGDTSADTYLASGAFIFGTLRTVLQRNLGKQFADFPRILDWGCGSGRVTRYFRGEPVQVTGVDVDRDNVAWCQKNLPFARFESIPLHPPTALPDAHFDLAIGISIFTHLTESAQFEWLAELRRVVKPGGILLMTYHGQSAVAAERITPEQAAFVNKRGILDLSNQQYDADLPETDYYRNTFHSDAYIRQEWGKSFEIVDLLPSELFVQDLAVLRRR